MHDSLNAKKRSTELLADGVRICREMHFRMLTLIDGLKRRTTHAAVQGRARESEFPCKLSGHPGAQTTRPQCLANHRKNTSLTTIRV